MALDIEISKGQRGICSVKLSGALDSETSAQFASAIESALTDSHVGALHLEMQHLKYIDSMGLGAIVKVRKAVEARGGVLTIVGAQPQILKVFEFVGMLPAGTVFANRQEADIYLAMIQGSVPGGGTAAG